MAKRKMSKSTKAKSAVDYGKCYWRWFGKPKVGVWIPDILSIIEGIDCKNGGVCIDPNTLAYKGRSFYELLIMPCRKPKGKVRANSVDCTMNYCIYELVEDSGSWQLVGGFDDCLGNQTTCTCAPPLTMNKRLGKRLKAVKLVSGASTTQLTFCNSRNV